MEVIVTEQPKTYGYSILFGLRGCYSDPWTVLFSGDLTDEAGLLKELIDAVRWSWFDTTILETDEEAPESPEAMLLEDCVEGVTLEMLAADVAKYIRGESPYVSAYLPLCVASYRGYGVFVQEGYAADAEESAF